MVTAPAVTPKLSEENDATPLTAVVASSAATVNVCPDAVVVILAPPAISNVWLSRSTAPVVPPSPSKSKSAAVT
jgi:hypothetical protein